MIPPSSGTATTPREAGGIARSRARPEALAAFVAARLLASIAGAVALTGFPSGTIPPALGYTPAPGPPLYNLTLGLWERFDAVWMVYLAERGWSPGNLGATVFPLYPLAIRALHALGVPSLIAALLISNACVLCGLYFVHRLAELDFDAATARRAVWLQALYPGTMFCLAPYAEAPYLALSAAALYAARTRRWALAGLLGAALSATRSAGLLFGLALAVELISQRRESPPIPLRKGLALLLVPLGLASVMLYWQHASGHPLEFLEQSQAWGRQLMSPARTLELGFAQTWSDLDRYPRAVYLIEGGAMLALLAVALIGLRVLRPSSSALLWLGIAPLLIDPVPLRIFCSVPRHAAVLFPAAIVVAATVRRSPWPEALRILCAGLYALCAGLYVCSQWLF